MTIIEKGRTAVGYTSQTDPELCNSVRAGDQKAFTELYNRHWEAGLAHAIHLTGRKYDAEDLAADAFAKILDVLKRGLGPTESFRGYLYSTLGNLRINASGKQTLALAEDADEYLPQLQVSDGTEAIGENQQVFGAFTSLPENWQQVLWYVEVEGLDMATISEKMGMRRGAVSQLAFRAREGLRIAYLDAHAEKPHRTECAGFVDKLARYVRDDLGSRDLARVQAHLDTCTDCTAALARLSDVGSQMRCVVAPLLLGGVTAGGLAAGLTGLGSTGLGSASAAVVGSATVSASSVGAVSTVSTVSTSSATGLSGLLSGKALAWGGAGLLAISAAVGGLLLGGSSDEPSPARPQPVAVVTPQPEVTSPPSPNPEVTPDPSPAAEPAADPAEPVNTEYTPQAATPPTVPQPAPAVPPTTVAPPTVPQPLPDEDDTSENWGVVDDAPAG